MLEYVSIINGNHNILGFVDEHSPAEWEPMINQKLYEYKESAYIDSKVKIDKIIVILELNSRAKSNSEYIRNEIKLFKDYYWRVLEDIRDSEFYDLFIK